MSIHIRPSNPTPLSVSKQTQAGGSNFHDTLKAKAHSAEAVSSPWTQELGRLSTDMKSGKISKEQACQQFVELVVSKQMDLGRFSRNVKEVERAVTEILEQDPHFMLSFETQFKKLS